MNGVTRVTSELLSSREYDRCSSNVIKREQLWFVQHINNRVSMFIYFSYLVYEIFQWTTVTPEYVSSFGYGLSRHCWCWGVASNCFCAGSGMISSRNRTRFGCLCNSVTGARGSGVSAM